MTPEQWSAHLHMMYRSLYWTLKGSGMNCKQAAETSAYEVCDSLGGRHSDMCPDWLSDSMDNYDAAEE